MEAHMAEYKIRVKVGANEFDAEGPKEFVEDLFKKFEALVAGKTTPALPVMKTGAATETNLSHSVDMLTESPLAKAFNLEGNRISLIGRFDGEDRELDAALLVLLGHKELKGVDAVSADELLYGLQQTGYTVERADRLMKRGKSRGLLNFHGIRRGTKYRLTVPGITKARELGKELLDMFQIS
jgi:hypothetical protein